MKHADKVSQLQLAIKQSGAQPLSLSYSQGHSNTTRSKAYKKASRKLACGSLNQILTIDSEKKTVLVEPRVTMDALVRATLKQGLIPPVVPEFKGITVGGAIMGAAAESTSHQWGIFHDCCTCLHFLDGRGNLIQASPSENSHLFYGLSGSYGSFGLLVLAEIRLIPAKQSVSLKVHHFSDPYQALNQLQVLHSDFVEGILFSKEHAVVIEGNMVEEHSSQLGSQWFAQQIKEGKIPDRLSLYEYLFRYDQGAFWMGNFLYSLPFLSRYLGQGILNIWPSNGHFTEKEVTKFKDPAFPNRFARLITHPFMSSQKLWNLLHKAEKWVQDRLIIQDCCIPDTQAIRFLSQILQDPALFPIWLCPIKGTLTPQFLAPHHGHPFYINFGLYGLPAYSAPMQHIISKLEQQTHTFQGRKVLYSRSYYDPETFWKIYPRKAYDALRQSTYANGTWRELTEKVLSE